MDGNDLGHFSLLEKIGEGGMGRVYKARDKNFARLVAIKLLPESRLSDTDRRARFVQEAKAASALNHPNIAPLPAASFFISSRIRNSWASDSTPGNPISECPSK